jgi:hypothetical protein
MVWSVLEQHSHSPYEMTDGPRPATLLAAPITPLVRLLAIPNTQGQRSE